MLETLHISNYALIEKIDINFHKGLNIITGETGAGKSIILGALSLLLGGRADNKFVRDTNQKSIIECSFNIQGYESLKQHLIDSDIDCDNNHCILRREISSTGRSRAFINDTPVNLTILQEIGIKLVDIHSQHQNQLLSSSDFQRKIIDSIAGNESILEEYSKLYSQFRESLRKLKTAKTAIARDLENADFMQYQVEQLDILNLQPNELAQLEEERDEMQSSSELKSYTSEALELLYDGNNSIIEQLSRVKNACDELSDYLTENDDIINRLDTINVELTDIAETISTLNSNFSSSPLALEKTEKRISDIRALMSKHRVDTDVELVSIHNKLRHRLEQLEDSDNIIATLDKEARLAHRRAIDVAKTISQNRKNAAKIFSDKLLEIATPLGMKNLCVVIDISPSDISSNGIDNVEFCFAFNKNQTPIPVSGAASGGEISRLMLSIKAIIADKIQLPSIIFDEVDTGVSGDVASRMGQMMLNISQNIQVIAITHLPQVAARGNHHFKVFKMDNDDATHTYINELSPNQRIDELALMLSGNAQNEAARANAQSLLSLTQ